MATTLEEIKRFLRTAEVPFDSCDEEGAISIGFTSKLDESTFRDHDGEPNLALLLRVVEDGDFLIVIAPFCWNILECPYRQAVCEALAIISGRFKMIRWDLDHDDGEVRPNIEMALEDARLTQRQLLRAIAGILQVVRAYDRVIRRTMETGEISFHDVELPMRRDADVDEPAPPASAPDIARLLELAEEAGGLDAIERLLGGREPPPVQS